MYLSIQQLLVTIHLIIFILNVWVFFILNKSCLQKRVNIHLLHYLISYLNIILYVNVLEVLGVDIDFYFY